MTDALAPGDPRQLGDYWLAGRLGAGGQGVVYEAYGPDGARVAIKALHGAFTGAGQRDMLAREVGAVARVSSFCTARVLASDLEGTPPYVVSEYVPGPDLQKSVEAGGPYAPGPLYRLAIGVATALVAVHRAGIVHRDLKPGNVLLGPDGPRVIDFGIARGEEMTRSATGVKGTPPYMAPELFAGERASAASDVWAWGAVVLFAALGRHPFGSGSMVQVAHRVRTLEPDVAGLAEPLRSVVAAALAKDPAARPSAHEVLLGLIGGEDEAGRLLDEGSRVAADVRAPHAPPPSLAEVAEAAYLDLDAAAREAVPAVLLRMVLPGEGADDTLRRADVREFDGAGADGGNGTDGTPAGRVVEAFSRAGLLVRESGRIGIASAALLRAWPRLREWVDAERDGLAAHRSLADAAAVWDGNGRRPGDLLQGSVLRRAVQWAATGRRHLTLNAVERAFLDACAALTRRRARLRGTVTGVLAVLLVVAVGAAAVAVRQSRVVADQRDRAVADRLAVLSSALHRDDPRTGRRLALAAARIADDDQTRQAALSAMYQWEDDAFAPRGAGDPGVPSLDPGGRTATLDDHVQVTRWDLSTHERLPVPASARAKSRTAFSPDGRRMAQLLPVGDPGESPLLLRRVQRYDASSGKPVGAPMGGSGESFTELAFSRSGNLLMADSGPQEPGLMPRSIHPVAALWDARDGHLVKRWKRSPDSWSVSADDRYVAMTDPDGLRIWDTTTRKPVAASWLKNNLANPKERARQVSFGPVGHRLAITAGTEVVVADLDAGAEALSAMSGARTLSGAPRHNLLQRGLDEPVFSPDGRFLAIGFTLWQLDGRTTRPVLDRRSVEYPSGCRFSPDAAVLRCATDDDRVVATSVGPYTGRAGTPLGTQSVVLSPHGDRAVLVQDAGFAVWDVARRRASPPIRVPGVVPGLDSAAPPTFSPDGGVLALPAKGAGYTLWDVRGDVRRPARQLARLDWPKDVTSNTPVTFSPDGRTLAAVLHTDRLDDPAPSRLHVWDARTGRRVRSTPVETGSAGPLVYAADGESMAINTAELEMPSGRVRHKLDGATIEHVLALDGAGATALVWARPGEALLWDVRTNRRKGPALAGASDINHEEPPAAFSPDGKLVATGGAKGDIHLYDVATGREYGLPSPATPTGRTPWRSPATAGPSTARAATAPSRPSPSTRNASRPACARRSDR
ncbi:WD40 repeat domain-containing serine/threonine protein kinase [Actinomadura yumaensis]|uniref:WD40 repeat domain-containing serine/threonine protein kinase n=1 Tax=Actinomadura yumaensis TaxID=111807 RepID=UPI003606A531